VHAAPRHFRQQRHGNQTLSATTIVALEVN